MAVRKLGFSFWGLLLLFGVFTIAMTWAYARLEQIVVHVPRGHHCEGCGYNLRDVRSETCPECGRGFVVPDAVPFAEPDTGDEAEPRL